MCKCYVVMFDYICCGNCVRVGCCLCAFLLLFAAVYVCVVVCVHAWFHEFVTHACVCLYISYMCIYVVVSLCKCFRLCVHVGSYTCVVMLELVYVFVSA